MWINWTERKNEKICIICIFFPLCPTHDFYCSDKCIFTIVTFEVFLSTVYFHMQCTNVLAWDNKYSHLLHLCDFFTVCNHMTHNNICSREGIITQVAFVRFDWMMFFLRSWAKIYSQSTSRCLHATFCPTFHLHMGFLAPQFIWLKNYFFN